MKCETLTYKAASIEDAASAPSILGRSAPSKGRGRAMGLSLAAMQIWLWLNFRLSVSLSKYVSSAQCVRPRVKVWCLPGDDMSGPTQIVRLNRHILRKLRRLARRRGLARFEDGFCEQGDSDIALQELSPGQFAEYMIRKEGMSRTHLYRLGLSHAERVLRNVFGLTLRGSDIALRRALSCAALLSPD